MGDIRTIGKNYNKIEKSHLNLIFTSLLPRMKRKTFPQENLIFVKGNIVSLEVTIILV